MDSQIVITLPLPLQRNASSAKELLGVGNTAWEGLNEMGLLKPFYIKGVRKPYYWTIDLMMIREEAQKISSKAKETQS